MNDNTLVPDRGQEAFRLENEVKQIKFQVGSGFLQLGKLLKEIKDSHYYIELGFETITAWLSSPDVSISQSWAYAFMDMHDLFIVKHHLNPQDVLQIDYSKLQQIVPVVKRHPEQLDEWMEKAQVLRKIDLQREIKEQQLNERHQILVDKAQVPATQPYIKLGRGDEELTHIATDSVSHIITKPKVTPDAQWVKDAYRVLAINASLLVLVDYRNLEQYLAAFTVYGFEFKRDLIWQHESRKGLTLNSVAHWHDIWLWAIKGKPLVNLFDITGDVWEFPLGVEGGISAQLADKLVATFTSPSELVLDPFAGHGEILLAAKRAKRNFLGFEEDPLLYQQLEEQLV